MMWRKAHSNQLQYNVAQLTELHGNPLEKSKYWNGDPSHVIYFQIEKDYRAVMIAAEKRDLESMIGLQPKLRSYEAVVADSLEMLRNSEMGMQLLEK